MRSFLKNHTEIELLALYVGECAPFFEYVGKSQGKPRICCFIESSYDLSYFDLGNYSVGHCLFLDLINYPGNDAEMRLTYQIGYKKETSPPCRNIILEKGLISDPEIVSRIRHRIKAILTALSPPEEWGKHGLLGLDIKEPASAPDSASF